MSACCAEEKKRKLLQNNADESRSARWCAWEMNDTTNTSKKLFSGKRASDDRTWTLRKTKKKLDKKAKQARACDDENVEKWSKLQKLMHWIRYKFDRKV